MLLMPLGNRHGDPNYHHLLWERILKKICVCVYEQFYDVHNNKDDLWRLSFQPLFFRKHTPPTTSFLRKRQFDFGEPWVCGSINFWDGVSVQDCSHNSIPKMHTRVVVHVLSSWKRAIFVHSFFLHKKKKSFLYKHFLISVCSSKQCTFCSLC